MPGPAVLQREAFGDLLAALQGRGYRVVGPTVRDGAIVYGDLHAVDDLPIGWTDEQDGGTYRLKPRGDRALFGYNVGPQSWKQYFHPPVVRLWRASRDRNGLHFDDSTPDGPPPKLALIGVRSCELHAIAIQDRVLLGGATVDPLYEARRHGAFIVAVQCGQAGRTCFCASMNAGPTATAGFDLALTEVLDGARHYFVAEAGTADGADLLARLPHRPAAASDVAEADARHRQAAAQMGRTMDTTGIKDLLYANADHPRWNDVASRCLTCGNCTMVCPTCFCTTVEEVGDLAGQSAERRQTWDSCFTMDFSYIHGGSIRRSAKSRYRQWMTHKLASWIDQFGSSGCVGCGRCITWCPVGIDLTEEVRAIRAGGGRTAADGEPRDGNAGTAAR
ncbi:MAG TPA: 4Fe-4S dicluster domain-containing protein [Vicinamibacterales bacterium]|nr:4Fe-4S dicluster domain-containing protein [Vicinamibacterales bacterium]